MGISTIAGFVSPEKNNNKNILDFFDKLDGELIFNVT